MPCCWSHCSSLHTLQLSGKARVHLSQPVTALLSQLQVLLESLPLSSTVLAGDCCPGLGAPPAVCMCAACFPPSTSRVQVAPLMPCSFVTLGEEGATRLLSLTALLQCPSGSRFLVPCAGTFPVHLQNLFTAHFEASSAHFGFPTSYKLGFCVHFDFRSIS